MELPTQATDALRLLFETTDRRVGRVLAQCGIERAGPGGPTRRQMHAYFLIEVQGWTLDRAAGVMGITPQSVHALLARARRKMKRRRRGRSRKGI